LGRVFFTAKAEPKINWSEIEARLQEISAPPPASDCPVEASLPVEPSATLAHDPEISDEPPVTKDEPVSIPGDPLDMLSMLAAIPSNRSWQNATLLAGIRGDVGATKGINQNSLRDNTPSCYTHSSTL
jgi:hypothetical protein